MQTEYMKVDADLLTRLVFVINKTCFLASMF